MENILWNSVGTGNCLVIHIIQNIFFCVQQKKEIHTGLEHPFKDVSDHYFGVHTIFIKSYFNTDCKLTLKSSAGTFQLDIMKTYI